MYTFLGNFSDDHWHQHQFLLGTSSKTPAFFYRLRRRDEYQAYTCVYDSDHHYFGLSSKEEKNEAKSLGRIYDPGNRHTWQLNLAWVLGLLHSGREIIINSKVELKNFYRNDKIPKDKNDTPRYSAFAKEMGAALKAGYKLSINDEGYICLTPPNSNLEHLRIEDIDPTTAELDEMIKKVLVFLYLKIAEVKKSEYLKEFLNESMNNYWELVSLFDDDSRDFEKDYLIIRKLHKKYSSNLYSKDENEHSKLSSIVTCCFHQNIEEIESRLTI